MSVEHWRGLKSMVHDAVGATVELVREGNESGSRAVRRFTDPVDGLAPAVRAVDGIRRVTTSGVLNTIHVINRATEAITDAGLDRLLPEPSHAPVAALPLRDDAPGLPWLTDAALGLVNAVVGDHLGAASNGLDLGMTLRYRDAYLDPSDLEDLTGPVAVYVHGLATTEWSWALGAAKHHGDPGANFGALLERDLGWTPLYLRYNTGRPIPDNGAALAALLEALQEAAPGIDALHIVGHSMGGLVARSACHVAQDQPLRWSSLLRDVVYLGSPHQGAPLARLGDAVTRSLGSIDLPATRVLSKILGARSQGIQDLQRGQVRHDAWHEPGSPMPLPHARHRFVAATITRDPDHVVTPVLGDLLVPPASASGPAGTTTQAMHHGHVWHHQVQNHPIVYDALLQELRGDP